MSKRVAIIGAGLAGTACAYILKQHGAEPVIYEAGKTIAPGASGNPVGLINPRFSAERTPESDYFVSGFAAAINLFGQTPDIGWSACGALHLMVDEKKQRRFPKTIKSWGWPEEHMRLLSAREASDVAGIEIPHDALYLPDAGYVSPKKLCEFYARGVEVHLNHEIKDLSEIKDDVLVLACGLGVKNFTPAKDLPINPVRGQITRIKASETSQHIKANLCFGGYMSPAVDGVHTLGATFQRWLDHSDLLDEDDQNNIKNLGSAIPTLQGEYEIIDRRASVRAASKDHFPIVGALSGNTYISAAHGSHGIISSLASAHLLSDLILGQPPSQSFASMSCLSPDRFSNIAS